MLFHNLNHTFSACAQGECPLTSATKVIDRAKGAFLTHFTQQLPDYTFVHRILQSGIRFSVSCRVSRHQAGMSSLSSLEFRLGYNSAQQGFVWPRSCNWIAMLVFVRCDDVDIGLEYTTQARIFHGLFGIPKGVRC